MDYTVRPGDFGLVVSHGWARVGIRLGQWLNGDLSRYTHAFLVLDDEQIIEAMPKGAEVNPLARYADREVRYSRHIPLTEAERTAIVAQGRLLVGVPYSFVDYLVLALVRFGVPSPRLKARAASPSRMICSELVDHAYCEAGVHLFNDGRLPHTVTPGDLDRVLSEDH